jgi:cell wall-associated NlpC family hydrolase
MLLECSLPVGATTVDEVKDEQEKTQQQLDALTDRMDGIENQKDAIAGEITVLDSQLVDIFTSISVCEDEIAEKEDEIDQVKVELQAAEASEQEQYENMKTRVRFMYEKGDQAYLEVFLEASSIADMINKASYVEQLYEYDRELLQEYQDTRLEVASIKEELETEEADLLTSQKELKEQQEYLEGVIAEKKATVANFDTQLVQAQQEANAYKKQLKEQNDKIRQLEEEEKEKEAELAKASSSITSSQAQSNTDKVAVSNPEQITDTTEQEKSAAETDQSSTTTTTTSTDTSSGLGSQIASYGCQFIGNPYVYGGTSLTNGTDCSGFTQSVYAHFGISIPRDSTSQRFCGTEVSYENARPGDIICYAGHVAIYIGNGQIVHASTERTGIKISNATYRTILSVRRIVN